MSEQLNTSFRPRKFSQLIGQDRITSRIRESLKQRSSASWLFSGESGSGKTTLGRIMAVSFNCVHQKEFGEPCRDCYKNRFSFDYHEVNASKDSGKERMEKIIADANIYPKHGSNCKTYLLDEFQRLSDSTQDMLLKLLEDSPKTTKWILCTSEPDEVIRAIWRRVKSYGLEPLKEDDIRKLIRVVLKFTGDSEDKCSPVKLTESLLENGITSSGFVVKAIESRLSGASYEEAAVVEFSSTFNPKALLHAVLKGDWNDTRKELGSATKEDARAIRRNLAAYLSVTLIESENLDDNTGAVAKAIEKLTDAAGENSIVLARVRASCFELCRIFKKNSR